jgi:hypothetical protein
MKDQKSIIIETALDISRKTESHGVFLFLNTARLCQWFLRSGYAGNDQIVVVVPGTLKLRESDFRKAGTKAVRSWSGNQTRFSQIKYAFFHGVMQGIIQPDSRVVCVLGPWGKSHLDTVTIHDLSLSWSEDFPFDPRSIIAKKALDTVIAVIDISLDIGALGREGKSVGTMFVIGDTDNVLKSSHQAVFNPFKGYRKKERLITMPEVVESIKELATLDGAIIISEDGIVEAAGRHIDAVSVVTKQLKGLGSRHRVAAGITRRTDAVAVVVSESTGRVTIFDKGRIVSTLEPVISRRLV